MRIGIGEGQKRARYGQERIETEGKMKGYKKGGIRRNTNRL